MRNDICIEEEVKLIPKKRDRKAYYDLNNIRLLEPERL